MLDKLKKLKEKNKILYYFSFAFLVMVVLRVLNLKRNDSVEITYNTDGFREISDTDAKAYAGRLYDAMRDCGTDEKSVKEILNSIQALGGGRVLAKVHNAFGRKKYAFFGSPALPFALGADELDLRQWLKRELSASEFSYWDALYHTIGK